VYFYHPDHLGSTSYVTDAKGEVYQHVEYFPFGESWVEQVKNAQQVAFGFTGKELDAETGLHYFGARYYDARTSVWVSPDPILGKYLPTGDKEKDKQLPGMGGVFNSFNLGLYSYGHLNPVKYTDPDGRSIYVDEDGNYLGKGNLDTKEIRVIKKEKWNSSKNLIPDSKSLSQYDEGIKITESTWKEIEKAGGKRLTPYVSNLSSGKVAYKPEEGGNEKKWIAPGTDLYSKVDGIKTSNLKKDKVYKVPTGVGMVVTDSGIFCPTVDVPNAQLDMGSIIGALYGEVDLPDSNWKALMNAFDTGKKK